MPSETQPQEDDKGSEQVGRAVVPCLSPISASPLMLFLNPLEGN